jgi:DnaA-homolog protein
VQLVLDIKLRQNATFDDIIVGPNATLIAQMQCLAQGQEQGSLFCWSECGGGVTHLLQAACHFAQTHKRQSVFLPLKELESYGVSIFEGLEALDFICIDDLEVILDKPQWQEALFHAFNRIKDAGKSLVVAGHAALDNLEMLPDLKSRLAWGGVFEVLPLSDEDKVKLLQNNAQGRGFELTQDLAHYLLNHYPRGMKTQLTLLERLDHASLEHKHKITLPFIKSVL